MKKEKNNVINSFEEDLEQVSLEEQAEIDSYMDEEIDNHMKEQKLKTIDKNEEKELDEEYNEEDLEEYEIEDDFVEKKEDKETAKKNRWRKISNIIFVVLLVLVLLAIIDVICVAKFDKGPFFAIPLHTYEDGGTKEYYGLGYKVIKYNQIQGRKDTELGTWSLKYNVDPIYIEMLDLAIEFNDNPNAINNYYKKLVVVTGNLKEVDVDNNTVTLEYVDDGGKYTTKLLCQLEEANEKISLFEPNYEITAMGTVMDYQKKTIYLENCFAEQ